MKKTFIIDGQVFQSGAWHRGMGKYSFELLKAIIPIIKKSSEEVVILLNKNLEIESSAENALEDLVGKSRILKLDLVQASRDAKQDIADNKKTLNGFIASQYAGKSVNYLILSLFLDNGCAVFPDAATKFLLFYDSIPFLYPEKYRERINYDNYLTHYSTVFEADKIFAISQTVADDTVLNFGISANKVINIDGARIGIPPANSVQPEMIDVQDKIILCPTGDELRKNNLRAVQGFELFNQRNNNEYKLVLTSFFSDFTIQQLNAVSDNIIFTKNIPFEQLEWLYEHAELILFPSEYEGLGLPILEAVTYGKKIVCSDIPVFREISEDAFNFFDPLNPVDLARKIESALTHSATNIDKEYLKITQKYTWSRTARVAYEAMESTEPRATIAKPKVAIFSPSPDGYSAIGKVVAETHASFEEVFDVTYYFEKGPEHRYLRPDFLSKIAKHYSVSDFNLDAYKSYDAILYHIGNSEYHLATISNALVYPGFTIFHDTNLGGAYGLLRTLGYMSNKRYMLEEQIDTKAGTTKGKFLNTVASNQIAAFTHSVYAQKAIKETVKAPKIVKLNLPVDAPVLTRHHKDNESATRIGLAGIIAGIKGIELIEELANNQSETAVDIKIFGYLQSDVIKNQLKRLANVTLVTNPTDFEFQNMLASLDILLNYRMKYQGETSLTVLEAMRHGVVVIVRDIGWYSELPDDAVVKVRTKEDAIAAALELSKDRKRLEQIAAKAKQYIIDNHSHEMYAKEIAATINGAIAGDDSSSKQVADYIKTSAPKAGDLKLFVKKVTEQ